MEAVPAVSQGLGYLIKSYDGDDDKPAQYLIVCGADQESATLLVAQNYPGKSTHIVRVATKDELAGMMPGEIRESAVS